MAGGSGGRRRLGERLCQGWPRRGDSLGTRNRPVPTPAPQSSGGDHRLAARRGGYGEEPGRFGGPGHLGHPSERRREQPANQAEQDELADAAAVGGEVAVVEHGQEDSQPGGDPDDDFDRGAGPGPAGLDS